MTGLVYLGIMIWTVVPSLAAGTIGALVLALAASIVGAFLGMALKWNEQNLWLALMAGPALLLIVLLSSAILDRLALVRENTHRSGVRLRRENW